LAERPTKASSLARAVAALGFPLAEVERLAAELVAAGMIEPTALH
jgi:DNA-binding IclR family transcriptional regulator